MTSIRGMDSWALILMFGVTAIWVALGGAFAYLVAHAQPTRR
jgi:ABC-type Fe3+ transport system permease subunit